MSLSRRAAACLLAMLAVLGVTTSCGSPSPVDLSITVDGEQSLVHYVPGGAARPLVVVLHGLGSSGAEMRRVTGLSAFADRNGFSVVFPDAHRVAPPVVVPTPHPTSTHSPTPTPTTVHPTTVPPTPTPTPVPPESPTPSPTATPEPSPTADPTPSDSTTNDPTPTDPAPTDAVPTDAVPTDAVPTDAVPTDPPSASPDATPPQDPAVEPGPVQQQRAALARTVNEVAGGAPSTSRAWNAGSLCCGGATGDDVAYLRHVVAAVALRVPVDRHRIYVWGLSNGGMMATRAICDAPDLFAAAGTVAGPYLGTRCGRPIWKHLHGGNDPVVPWYGGRSPGVLALGVVPDWCRCSFPSSATEAARLRGYVSVTYVPGGIHGWPTTASAWRLDGDAVLWQAVSPFRR